MDHGLLSPRVHKPKTDPVVRFWSKVDKTEGLGPFGDCWEWLGTFSSGYGVFYYVRGSVQATHFSWWLEHGTWPEPKIFLDHIRCSNPKCIRASHLKLATIKENTQRYFDEERGTCKYGHPWVPENITKGMRGRTRRCKICHRQRAFAKRNFDMTLKQFMKY